MSRPVEPKDPFVLGDFSSFGVVLRTNAQRDLALVQMQNGRQGEIPLAVLVNARDALEQYRVDS